MYNTNQRQLLSTRDAAEALGYTHDYVSKMCRNGYLKAERSGNTWLIEPASIEEFKKNHNERLTAYREIATKRAKMARKDRFLSISCSGVLQGAFVLMLLFGGSVAFAQANVIDAIEPSSNTVLSASVYESARSLLMAADTAIDEFLTATGDVLIAIATSMFSPNIAHAPAMSSPSYFGTSTTMIQSHPTASYVTNYITNPVSYIYSGTGGASIAYVQKAMDNLRRDLREREDDDDNNTGGGLTDLTSSSIEELSDVAAMTKSFGDVFLWDGGQWTNVATSTLGIALSDTTGVLGADRGGTGQSGYTIGDILYADTATTFAKLPIGVAGQVLKVSGGLPMWGADATGSGGSGAFSTSSDSLSIYPTDTSDVVIIGAAATTTTGNILEVAGNALFRNALTAYGLITAPRFTATSSVASVFPYASTTGISSSYASTTSLFAGNLTLGTLSGILKATAGVVSVATAGTDFESPLSFVYPLVRSVNSISLAFGTTTANTWSAHNIFSSLFATNASSTNATTTSLGINNETFTDLTGSGLTNVGGALTVSTSGNWTGTFDGQEGTYYLDRANHTGTQLASTISDFNEAAQDTIGGALVDSTRIDLVYDDALNTLTADIRNDTIANSQLQFNTGQHLTTTSNVIFASASTTLLANIGTAYFGSTATTTISSDGSVVLPSGATLTIGTLTGLLRGTNGLVSVATPGTDYIAGGAGAATTTVSCAGTASCSGFTVFGSSPITITGAGGGLSAYDAWTHPVAGGSATTSLMLFNGAASSTQFSATQAYFGGTATSTFTSAGFLGIGSSTPWGQLSINPNGIAGPAFAIGSSTGTSFVVTNAGNVGVGTTSPFGRLGVTNPDGSSNPGLYINQVTNEEYVAKFIRPITSPGSDIAITLENLADGNETYLQFANANTGTNGWQVGIEDGGEFAIDYTVKGDISNPIFNILRTELVGIGTTSPYAKLSVDAPAGQSAFAIGSSTRNLFYVTALGTTTVGRGFDIIGAVATSSSNVGFNITSGCFSVNNVCVGSSGLAGTGANTQVGYFTGAGTLASDAGMTYDATADRLTVTYATTTAISGTNSHFGVVRAGGAASSYSEFGNNGTTNYWSSITDAASIFTGGSERLRILTSGNVGVGTSTPSLKLDVYGDNGNGYSARFVSALGNSSLGIRTAGGLTGLQGLNSTASNIAAITLNAAGGFVSVGTSTATYAPFAVLGDSGVPSQGFSILTNTYVQGSSGSYLRLGHGASSGSTYGVIDNIIGGGASYGNLVLQQGGGNVGIGTTTPQWLLNPMSSSASQLALSAGSGVAQWAFRNAGGNFYLSTTTIAGTATSTLPAFTILNSSGNVGIGISAPTQSLTVSSAGTREGYPTSALFSDSTDTTEGLFFGYSSSGNYGIIAASRLGSAWHNIALAPGGGNIGIGTTTPYGHLSVAAGSATYNIFSEGEILSTANNSTTAGFSGYATIGGMTHVYSVGRDTNGMRLNSLDDFKFFTGASSYTGGTERLRITSAGNVGIGSTSPNAKLVVQSSGVGSVALGGWSTDANYGAIYLNNGFASGNNYNLLGNQADALYINRQSGAAIRFREANGSTDQFTLLTGGSGTFPDGNLSACTGGACPTGTPAGNGNIIAETAIGVGSSTPWAGLSIVSGKALVVAENTLATSTSMTVDWRNGNQQLVRTGTSGTTISFSGFIEGQKLVLTVCNPNATAGAITWGTQILWTGGTAPTQTTTANKCDVWSFLATAATSTLKIFGTQSANF